MLLLNQMYSILTWLFYQSFLLIVFDIHSHMSSYHTINPLSLAFQTSKLQKLKAFGIPENEVPILIIGAGYLPDNFNVAVSDRKPIEKTNTFH